MDRQEALRALREADEVCSAQSAREAVRRLAGEASAALRDRNPLVIVVMRGAVVFAGQLLPQLDFPLDVDYVDLTRYGDATSGGAPEWRVAPGQAVSGRDVLVLDDILDEGLTLAALRERLLAAGAASVRIAVFSEKDTGRGKAVRADFVGVTLPDRYVFGFGMDYKGAWRNLPAVYALKETR